MSSQVPSGQTSGLASFAHIRLRRGEHYLPPIIDRLNSYETRYRQDGSRHLFGFPFGHIAIETSDGGYDVALRAAEEVGLHRLKDLAAVAIKLYTKEEAPEIVWQGDRAGEQALPQFRLMRVVSTRPVTPHMQRVRLAGEDLGRFALFGALHVRLLFPTDAVPQPVWPVMGLNGLPFWPDEARKPASRAFTIRNLDVAAGWLEIDFYLHATEGLACRWAREAQAGDEIGLTGPVGRPLRRVHRYIIGSDPTGLPAVGRILEQMAPDAAGHVLIAVDSADDMQPLAHPEGVTVEWIVEADAQRAARALTERLCAMDWPEGETAFGWFAGEADQAKIVRAHWRGTLGRNRDQTLSAGYWQKDATGFMAG